MQTHTELVCEQLNTLIDLLVNTTRTLVVDDANAVEPGCRDGLDALYAAVQYLVTYWDDVELQILRGEGPDAEFLYAPIDGILDLSTPLLEKSESSLSAGQSQLLHSIFSISRDSREIVAELFGK
ncbi:MAG: hypothetical protein CL610_24140 [Anaerolineaceae bacterium]|nr:hypothetical protein [Anaerolineaceae bacterium]